MADNGQIPIVSWEMRRIPVKARGNINCSLDFIGTISELSRRTELELEQQNSCFSKDL
jgi:hypothetical protein